MAIQRPTVGFKLHEAPHTGEIGGNKIKRGNFERRVVPGFLHFDLYVDFVSRNQPRIVWGLSWKVSNALQCVQVTTGFATFSLGREKLQVHLVKGRRLVFQI